MDEVSKTFAQKEMTALNENVVIIAKDKEAMNVEVAGVVAVELANSFLKRTVVPQVLGEN